MENEPSVGVVSSSDLVAIEPAPTNLTVERAFETAAAVVARVRIGTRPSSWHNHGARDAYGIVLVGDVRIEYGPGDGDVVVAGPETFVHVPAGVTYRVTTRRSEATVLMAYVGAGDPITTTDGPPSDSPDPVPRIVGPDDLVPAGELEGLVRLTPFPDAAVQQVRGHADGAVESDWHHHGDNDVIGYVIEGEGYVEWGTEEGERKLARAGEWFRVPAGIVHRDVNPSDASQEYVLWLTGSEPRIVSANEP